MAEKFFMKQNALEQKIYDLITPDAQDLGLEVVYVQLTGDTGTKQLTIVAEDPKTLRLGVDQCAKLSRAASTLLDVEDWIDGAYRLEVSSPGIDRLLVREKDFDIFKNLEAKIEMTMPAENGQKRFRGMMKGIDEDKRITLDTDEGVMLLDFADVKKAKLVMNDTLIAASAELSGS